MKKGKCVISRRCNIKGVLITPLKVIDVEGGDVLHGMTKRDRGYSDFGEAYFTTVESGAIKAWKRHRQMTLNLIVPIGKVLFVIYDTRQNSDSNGKFDEVTINRVNNYSRLTVPPMVWMGFQGLGASTSMVLNIADIEHVPEEEDRIDVNAIIYKWVINKYK